jgi:tetratricopeptide (TPR) repeat protein
MFHFGRKSNSTAESHAPKADQKKIEVAELVAAGDDANRNRDWPRAEQAYRSALDVSPDLAHIWVQFGHSLKEQGRLPEAETAYRKASELKPEDADAMLQLGHLLKLRARYDEALTAYRKSHELAPESADARTEVTWMEQFLASKVGSAKAGEAHNETRASDYVQGQSTDVSDMVPEVIGTIERVADTYVEGWARATNRQSNVILVELLIDGVSVGITEANLPRPDLAEKGAGSSNCGFRCAVPAKLCDGKFHTITARALGIPLANSASTTGLVRLGFSLPALFIHSPEGKSPSIGAEPLQAKVPEVEGARAPKSCLHLKPGGGGLVDLFPLRSSAGSVKNLIFALCRSEEDWRSLDRFTQELELRDYNVIIVAQSGTANASAGLSGNFSECERYILIEYAQPADEFAAFLQLFNSECLLEYSWIGYINFSGFDPEKEESAIPAYVTQFDRPDVLSSRVTYLASVATQEVKRFLGTCLPRIGRSFRGDDIRIPCGTVTWIPDILYRQARALPIGAQELRTAAGDTKNLHQPVLALLGALASDGGLLVSGMNVRSWANSGRQSTKHIAPLTAADTKIKAIAFYLPQFHPIAENDRWWGRGFTEWSNVLKGRPLFRGHHQPRLPGELGFYDLRVPDVQEQQARLARENGVYGFCYYYYWFNGQKLLNRPIEQMLRNHAPAQPFCVCWANENWSRNWDGQNRHVLLRQDYSIESNRELIKEFITMMRDPRYIRYQGKPVVVVYRISVIPNWPETAAMWREECRKAGIGEIHLCAVRFGLEPLKGQPSEHGLDAYVLFPPHELERHDIRQDPREQPHDLAKDFNGELVSYDVAIQGDIDRFRYGYPWPVHRGVTMNWDNTARRGTSARIFYGATPLRFRHWLNAVVEQELEFGPKDESLLFINAWNEWAEGTVLEPDQRYADTYLRVVRRELARYSEPFIATEVGRAYLRASNERSKTKQTEVAHAYSPVAQVSRGRCRPSPLVGKRFRPVDLRFL